MELLRTGEREVNEERGTLWLSKERLDFTSVVGSELQRAKRSQLDHRRSLSHLTVPASAGHTAITRESPSGDYMESNGTRRIYGSVMSMPERRTDVRDRRHSPEGGPMRVSQMTATVTLAISALGACAERPLSPRAVVSARSEARASWGPETPHFNLEVVLRGEGFGLVKFRQPNDAEEIIYLDTWVRGLTPNTSYALQRAVDTTVDGNCTSTSWLTLGKGATPQAIVTDERGTGREDLFRSVAAFPVGSQFDIHFRVIDTETGAVVLESGCYEFTISL